jgi:hypothetical protein
MRFRRLAKFSVKDILQAINDLQKAVESLQPRQSSGTLQSQGSGGTITKASSAANRRVTQPSADDRPARWQ